MDDPQNPPASSGSKTFGIHKFNPEYCLGPGAQREDRRRGYEDKYEDDAMGEELSDDARIWRVMLDEGRVNDAAMLQRFRDHLDVDLVFAGLFSAVLTTFVVQTSQPPPKTGDTTVALLLEIIAIQRAWANSSRVNDVASFSIPLPPPSPSPWINRCWYLSLIFSLLAAFGAVVVRQWLQEYESDITGPPKRRALVRHYRRVGLEKYKVHLIVPILPMLLHVSLLLFFVGLTLYVRESDRSMANGIIALTVMIYLVYLGTNLMPVFRPQCPYRSPLSTGVHWARSLVALLYALLPTGLRMQALLPFSIRSLSSTVPHVHALIARTCARLPPHTGSSLSTSTETVKSRLRRTLATLRDRLQSFRKALKKSWKEVFKVPEAHEWEAVLDSSDTMIPDSLDSMAQASSDLSVTPLVVQASSSLPIDRPYWGNCEFEDPRSRELLRRRILPWFVNALSTRRMVFDWAPGRENELQRMTCALLLVPLGFSCRSTCFTVLWEEIDTNQYRTCISHVFQALTSALLNLPSTAINATTDVATLSMTLLALGNRLDDLDRNSQLLRNGALFNTISTAYSSLPEPPSLAVLCLRPIIWHRALTYLRYHGRPMDDAARFAITLWQHAYSEAPFPDGNDRRKEHLTTLPRLNLQEWLYLHPARSEMMAIAMYRLLCPQSCESHESLRPARELSHASHLHVVCHAIDLFVKEDSAEGDAAFDHLVAHFTGLLLATLGHESINSVLRIIGHSTVLAASKSAFLVRPALPLAKFLKVDERLPAPFAVSLLCFFVKLATAVEATDYRDELAVTEATDLRDKQLAIRDVLHALDHHSKEYHDALTQEFPVEYLRPAIEMILWEPQLAVLEFWDGIATLLATQLSKPATELNLPTQHPMYSGNYSDAEPSDLPDMTWCLYLDTLCAAHAATAQISSTSHGASLKLHSALLSLKSLYLDTRKSELTLQLKKQFIPLAVALALKSTHGCKALAEWVDDLPTLVQDSNSGLEVSVPDEAWQGSDLNWYDNMYRLFSSDPDKHIHAPIWGREHELHISELVSFEEAVERMQKTDAERAVVEAQRYAHGDGAEADANDDAENAGRVHGGLENQGGAELTQNETTDRFRTLGAWVVAPLQRVRPFLARIPGLRPVGGRVRPSSFALSPRDVDTDVERIAGTSVARDSGRSGGEVLAPMTVSEGGHIGAELAVTERSGGSSHLSAWASEGGSDGEHAQDDAQGRADEQSRVSAQAQYDENRRDGEHGRDDERGPDDEHAQEDAHAQDDERSQAGEVPHVQRGQTPDEAVGTDAREAVGTDAREDVEHGGDSSARGNPDAGRGREQDHSGEQGHDGEQGNGGEQVHGGEQGHDEEQVRGGEHDQTGEPARGDQHGRDVGRGRDDEQARDGAQDREGEQDWNSAQSRAGAQDPSSAQSQTHDVPHARTQETEVEVRAHDDAADEGEH